MFSLGVFAKKVGILGFFMVLVGTFNETHLATLTPMCLVKKYWIHRGQRDVYLSLPIILRRNSCFSVVFFKCSAT